MADFSRYMQLGFGTTGQLGNAGPHVQVAQQIAQALTGHNRSEKMPDGKRPIVICRGVCEEAKDMEAAQSLAEAKAHEMNADAYILKPVKRVAPKRDVVTTDLP